MEITSDIQEILNQLAPGSSPEQIIAALVESFTSGVNKAKSTSKTAYQEAIEAIESNYEKAAVGRGSDFQSNFDFLGDNLANLGENFSEGGLGASYAANQQYLTEAADTALATDLAWFEKMQETQAAMYDAMLIEMAAQQALSGATASVGGSSGGGSSGGSSSSGPYDPQTGQLLGDQDFTSTAEEETRFYNPYWAIEIDKGRRGESAIFTPEEAEFLADETNLSRGGGPVEVRGDIQAQIDGLQNAGFVNQETGEWVPGMSAEERFLSQMENNERVGSLGQLSGIGDDIRLLAARTNDRITNNLQAEFLQTILDKAEQFDPNWTAVQTQWKMDEVGRWKAFTLEGVPLTDEEAMQYDPVASEIALAGTEPAFRQALTNWEANQEQMPATNPTIEQYGSIGAGFKEAVMQQEIQKAQQEADKIFARHAANKQERFENALPNLPDHLVTRDQQPEPLTYSPVGPTPDFGTQVALPQNPGFVDLAQNYDLVKQQAAQNLALTSQPTEAAPNINAFDNLRREAAEAAARVREREEREAALAQNVPTITPGSGSMARPGAVEATQENPHPMGKGTFGQSIRTAVPFHVAAPKKPTRRDFGVPGGGVRAY